MIVTAFGASSPYLNSALSKQNNTKQSAVKYQDDGFKAFMNQTKPVNNLQISKYDNNISSPAVIKPNQSGRIDKLQIAEKLSYLMVIICMFSVFSSLFKDSNKAVKNAISANDGFHFASEMPNIWLDNSLAPKLKDLALPDKLKDTAKRLIYKIQNHVEYLQKGGTNKKTILLYGPPGTGKTTFARAISQEFPDSKFASIDLSLIEGKYVGESQQNLNKAVDEVCNYAKNNPGEKVFVFFDEIDSIAIQDNGSSNQQYHATVLNTLKKAISEKLTKFDNIITIASTNIDIDKAEDERGFFQKLSAPIVDRFDEKIRVDNPTSSQFASAIAKHYSTAQKVENSLKNAESKEVKTIADALADKKSSFRVLENLYNVAASNNKPTTEYSDLMNALKDVLNPECCSKVKIGFRQN